jgi:hypothetical protein
LIVGAQNNDGTFFARVEGRDGTFAISGPDFIKLKLPLESQGAVSPSPAATSRPGTTP